MSKPLSTMMRSHDMACRACDATELTRRARRKTPNALFEQSPCGLDRIEVVRVRRQKAQRGTARFDQTPGRLSSKTISPRRSRGAKWRRTHSVNECALRARHRVPSVTQPAQRIAPISVRLVPQFIGRASTYSVPRGTHACVRPMARFAPASSRNTSRRGSIRCAHVTNLARCAWISGRSTSLGRGRFF
jgi:hypothetical protein